MGGLYNGDPAIRANRLHGADWSMDGPFFAIGEAGYQINGLPGDGGPMGNYNAGFWYDDSRYLEFRSGGASRGNWGLYGLFDQVLVRFGGDPKRGFGVSGSVLVSPDQSVSWMSFFPTAGVLVRGLFPSRPTDVGGFGVVFGQFSDDLRDSQRRARELDPTVGVQRYEIALEMTYWFRFRQNAMFFQPDLQYVIRPGGTGRIRDAFVAGFQSKPAARGRSASTSEALKHSEGSVAVNEPRQGIDAEMAAAASSTAGGLSMIGTTPTRSAYVIALSSVAALGGFLFGFDSGVINGAVDALSQAFGTRTATTGFAVASVLLGCAGGAFVAGTVADRHGRRPTMLLNAMLFLGSAVAVAPARPPRIAAADGHRAGVVRSLFEQRFDREFIQKSGLRATPADFDRQIQLLGHRPRKFADFVKEAKVAF